MAGGNISVAVIRAFSVGLAISIAIFFLLKVPTMLERQTFAIPPISESARTDGSAASHLTGRITPPPPEELNSVRDEFPIGQHPGNHPPGFRGLAWGSPPTSTMIKVGGPFGSWKASIWRDTNRKLNPAFGASVTEESYFFRGGGLYGGELIFDSVDNFRKLRGGLTEVLGPPNFADEEHQVFKWQWQNPEIELRISYQKTSHRSALHLERQQQPMAGRGGSDASASAELSQAAQLHDRRPGRHARRATHRMPDVRRAGAPVTSPPSPPSDDEGPDRQGSGERADDSLQTMRGPKAGTGTASP